MKTTHTAVERNRNSWVGTPHSVDHYEVIADCGHKHKSIEAAQACQAKMADSSLGRYGRI